ncbi:SDR family oxidoreductase [Arthrobacter sp. I2-34]|uniref:SDR family oxidoreductase n=1 Tax=Arthrobacter hankyongi TaxID=2904801 RepID=A0ABS9L7I4_9MICC|nr:SDR family NAD(P)-dependent oxidoreductase [Arthrobacter hankyongi]MCG2622610.1 SDR family oxidoreductase [Arthrobacter hankyongi]
MTVTQEPSTYPELFSLTGRRAVVTGAGKGIGREIATALAEAGAHVIVAELDKALGQQAAAELVAAGGSAEAHSLDVTDGRAVEEFAAAVGAIDILVNNAGVAYIEPPLETTDEGWAKTMDVNCNAAFWCSRAFGRRMAEQGSGSIVNVGSICGQVVTRPQNSVAYMTSKGAIHMMTKSMATDLAPRNVRVNAVAPGYVETAMTQEVRRNAPEMLDAWVSGTPMGRLARPAEVAAAVLFLASDASSYCTGSVLNVDGGYTAW